MSGLAWLIVALLVMIGGLAFAAYLMNMPLLLILAGSAFALLIAFLLVTRGPRPTSAELQTPEPAGAGDESADSPPVPPPSPPDGR